jgi:general secretion pathway protein J
MRGREGITLIEAMLAITILGMIGTSVYSAFVQTANNKERIETSLDRHRMVAATLDRMQREISMAYVSVHVPINQSLIQVRSAFIGKARGANSRLDFASFSHQRLFRGAKESDQNEIGYFIARHPEDRARTVLARREQNRVDHEPEKGGKLEVLLEDVSSLEFEYLDPTTNLWTKSWDTTQLVGQPNRLPKQVKIRIKVPDPANPKRTITFGTRATIALVYALNHAAYNP